jgi:hypothetical protein
MGPTAAAPNAGAAAADASFWFSDYPAAKLAARQNQRPLLVVFR